jgi:ATP-binding cassette subfamily B protein
LLKLLKYLKKYKWYVLLILVLVAAQAVAQLTLPDYMSRIIGEGIRSPAYQTTEPNGGGEPVICLLDPRTAALLPGENAALFAVKKYERTVLSPLVLNAGGYAQLVDTNGAPIGYDENGRLSGAPAYEKDASGNFILDSRTRLKIPLFLRDDMSGFIVTDKNGEAAAGGYEAVMGPYLMPVVLLRYQTDPAPLALDRYGNAVLAGLYTDAAGGAVSVRIGEGSMPAARFEREGTDDSRFGTLLLDAEGFAQIAQVSYLSVILKYGLIMLAVTFLISAAAVTANFFASKTSMAFGKDIRSAVYKKVNAFSAEDSGKFGTASLITRTTNDVTQVQQLILMSMRMVVMTPVMFIGGLIMALQKSADMTLVLLFSIPVILAVVVIAARLVIPLFKRMQKSIDRLTLVSRESLTGVRVIRAFGREDTEDKRYAESNREVADVAVKANRIMSALMPVMMVVMSFTSLAVVLIAVLVAKNDIAGTTFTAFGNMMAVTQYIMQIMMSLLMVMLMFVMFPRASASAARINEVLAVTDTIPDAENPVLPQGGFKGVLRFENVSFRFAGSARDVLSGISLTCEPGTVTAFIGSTGSGKSTLINLIPRLHDVTAGRITLDGADIRGIPQKTLREQIAFAPQKALLFTGTVRDNLLFGSEGASEERLRRAAEISQSEEFLSSLPDGLDHEVDQGGVNFSGGQKQRLSIARALVRDAKIYIFDDCFSALDFKTDAKLRKALAENMRGSTVLMVAQRIGTVRSADNIVVLDEGGIAGMGKHAGLLQTCPVYREIALSQLSEEELENE